MRDLIDGYFSLRRQSKGLQEHDHRFEGLPWSFEDACAVRKSDGWTLRVYRDEGDVGACVIHPNGTITDYI